MRRIVQFGTIGGIAAVALVAHLWMFPAFDGPSTAPHTAAAPVTTVADTPLTASCPSGMSACIATSAEELRLPLAVMISTLPALLWVLHRRPSHHRRSRPSRHGPEPPRSPVDERVLLLE